MVVSWFEGVVAWFVWMVKVISLSDRFFRVTVFLVTLIARRWVFQIIWKEISSTSFGTQGFSVSVSWL